MEGSHLSVEPEQNNERQAPTEVNSTTDQSPPRAAHGDQSAVADTLPSQEASVATLSADVSSTTESASQSTGASFCRKASPSSGPVSEKDGSGEQEASVHVEGSARHGRECQLPSGTCVSDKSKGTGGKSADHQRGKQAGAASVESSKDGAEREAKDSSFGPKSACDQSTSSKVNTKHTKQLERIQEERGNVSSGSYDCHSEIFFYYSPEALVWSK